MDSHNQFVGSIPEIYETFLGPFLFLKHAQDLASRLRVPERGRVLEVACGTGIATEAIHRVLPSEAWLTATDLSEPMLEFAKAKRGHLQRVTFEHADAESLQFEDNFFDTLVCQFGLMFLQDKRVGLREFLRVIKPGGQIVFNVWDSLATNPILRLAGETIGMFFEGDPPNFLSIPFGYHRLDPIRDMLSGLEAFDVAFNIVRLTGQHDSAIELAKGLVEGNPGVHEIRKRSESSVQRITEAVGQVIGSRFGDAPVRATLQAIVVTIRK